MVVALQRQERSLQSYVTTLERKLHHKSTSDSTNRQKPESVEQVQYGTSKEPVKHHVDKEKELAMVKKIGKLEQQLHAARQELRQYKVHDAIVEIQSQSNTSNFQSVGGNIHLVDAFWKNIVPFTLKTPLLTQLNGQAEVRKSDKALHVSNVTQGLDKFVAQELISHLDQVPYGTIQEWKNTGVALANKLRAIHIGFHAIAGIFQRISAIADQNNVVEMVAREIKPLIQAESAYLFVVEPTSKNEIWTRVLNKDKNSYLTIRSILPHVPSYYENFGHVKKSPTEIAYAPKPSGIIAYVVASGNAMLIPHTKLENHPLRSNHPHSGDRFLPESNASILVVPMYDKFPPNEHAKPIGAIVGITKLSGVHLNPNETCSSIGQFDFSKEDQALLQGVSNFAGPLVKKARYYTNIERNKKNEEFLLDLAQQIFGCLDLESLSNLVIARTKALLDADRCTLFITKIIGESASKDQVLQAYHSDINSGEFNSAATSKRKTLITVPFGEGIAGSVADEGKFINITDAYEDIRFNQEFDASSNYRTKSILAMPILGPNGSVLGVIEMINKAGGTAFSNRDEALLHSTTTLIALAIENSRLFYKTKDMCQCLGSVIKQVHVSHAVNKICELAKDIVGVQEATIVLLNSREQHLYTFAADRVSTKTEFSIESYSSSLTWQSLDSQSVVINNDVANCKTYNTEIDSPRHAFPKNIMICPLFDLSSDGSKKNILGFLQLVNKIGDTAGFSYDDLFVSIVISQASGILSSILEKQQLCEFLNVTRKMLDTTKIFYEEVNEKGLMNSVNNASIETFKASRGHLLLWNEDRTSLWTSKPLAAFMQQTNSKSSKSTKSRRVSISAIDQMILSPREGICQEILNSNEGVIISDWGEEVGRAPTSSDRMGEFVGQCILGHPVYDAYGLEVVGLIILVKPKIAGYSNQDLDLLPLFCKQVSTALAACQGLQKSLHRSKMMQYVLEHTNDSIELSFTLNGTTGALISSSYPLSISMYNSSPLVDLKSFQKVKASVLQIPVDEFGNRRILTLTTCSDTDQCVTSYEEWLGVGVPGLENLKQDIRNGMTKDIVKSSQYHKSFGISSCRSTIVDHLSDDLSTKLTKASNGKKVNKNNAKPSALDEFKLPMASILWNFLDEKLQINTDNVISLFSVYDTSNVGILSSEQIIHVLKSLGIQLTNTQLLKLCELYTNPKCPDGVFYKYMILDLCPRFSILPHFRYEVHSSMDPLTHEINTVQVFLKEKLKATSRKSNLGTYTE